MKALLKDQPKKGANLADVKIPKIGDDHLLLQVKAASICGTDIHIYKWSEFASTRFSLPFTFGHEFSGEVVEIGKNVKNFKIGDRVAGEPHIPCQYCLQCTTGYQHVCKDMQIFGLDTDGAFAEYTVLPAVCAWKIDQSISYDIGAMMEPFGIAVHAISKTITLGKKVIVFGCGPIGIFAQITARLAGAEFVIGVDISEKRLALSKEMGADYVYNSKKVNIVEKVESLTKGLGIDIAVELTGNNTVANQAAQTLRRGGELILVGLFDAPVELDVVNNIIYKEANVYGVTGRIMWDSWWTTQNILTSGKIDISPLITHNLRLDQYEEAFKIAEKATAGKILFSI
jgi:threonine 3-dehydrogenase